MVVLNDLIAWLNDLMGDLGDREPYMPNGLQVRGKEEIKLLATGVGASLRRRRVWRRGRGMQHVL